jgi:hypothetical protein
LNKLTPTTLMVVVVVICGGDCFLVVSGILW